MVEHLGAIFPGKKPLVVLSAGRAQRIQVRRARAPATQGEGEGALPAPRAGQGESPAAVSPLQKLDPALRTFFARLEEQGSFFVTPFGSNDDW